MVFVDVSMCEPSDPPPMTVPGVAADILREVIPQVDSIRMRIMILEPFYWGEGRAEDAVWEALLYAGDHGIKLDKSYWPAIVQLAKEEEFEDVLKDVDPSIFE